MKKCKNVTDSPNKSYLLDLIPIFLPKDVVTLTSSTSQFHLSILHKSVKNIGHCFVLYVHKLWNDLPNNL